MILIAIGYRCGADNFQIQVRYLITSVIGLILISIGYRCGADYLQIQVRYILLSDTGVVLNAIVDTGVVLITFSCRSAGLYTDYHLIKK